MIDDHYILDTHTLIWFQENNPKVPDEIMKIIQTPDNTILFSQISLFEISIKQKIGKLPSLFVAVEEIYQQAIYDGFTFLPIQNSHIYKYRDVTLLSGHRDPFDRLLIATALAEQATILTADEKFSGYDTLVKVRW